MVRTSRACIPLSCFSSQSPNRLPRAAEVASREFPGVDERLVEFALPIPALLDIAPGEEVADALSHPYFLANLLVEPTAILAVLFASSRSSGVWILSAFLSFLPERFGGSGGLIEGGAAEGADTMEGVVAPLAGPDSIPSAALLFARLSRLAMRAASMAVVSLETF